MWSPEVPSHSEWERLGLLPQPGNNVVSSAPTQAGESRAVVPRRYRSPAMQVQAWYDEVKDYTYPYPHECDPWCPERCAGPMCSHYTQVTLGAGRAPPRETQPMTAGIQHLCRLARLDAEHEAWKLPRQVPTAGTFALCVHVGSSVCLLLFICFVIFPTEEVFGCSVGKECFSGSVWHLHLYALAPL